jgi:hypothetical protein
MDYKTGKVWCLSRIRKNCINMTILYNDLYASEDTCTHISEESVDGRVK